MRATKTNDEPISLSDRGAITTDELRTVCGCGRNTAIEIGTKAGARIQIGRRVLWNARKVIEYLDRVSC